MQHYALIFDQLMIVKGVFETLVVVQLAMRRMIEEVEIES